MSCSERGEINKCFRGHWEWFPEKRLLLLRVRLFLYVCVRACVRACACTCVSVHYDGIESEHGDGSPEGEDRPELAILKYNTSLSNTYL